MNTPADKTCASCGRRFSWRRKWARDWDEVRYCSDSCRRRKVTGVDRRLQTELARLLDTQPSVDPLAVVPDGDHDVELARRAARRLVASGRAEIVQHGRVVDPSRVRGPFTLRRVAGS